MSDLLVQNASIIVVKLVDLINVIRALCYQGTFDKIVADIVEIVVSSKLLDVRDQLSLGDSGERVLDSVMVST